MIVRVPPIKSQGIKTKLVPWINSIVPTDFAGVWIEPFMGTGVVGFNIAPHQAILCDNNPHLIAFYSAILHKKITPRIAKEYLIKEGDTLLKEGESYYYFIRQRFNEKHDPLDFLFLSRAGFNGMIRFNQKGGFNVPFCRKPNRFAKAYITKIVNQIDFVEKTLTLKEFTFQCQDFEETIRLGTPSDIIYCDPPYIGRYADYFNGWDATREERLFSALSQTSSKFILSTWHHNDFRANEFIDRLWNRFNIVTRPHFYHVGASEKNRNPMIEAIVTNIDLSIYKFTEPQHAKQLQLLEGSVEYKNELWKKA